LDGLVWVRGFLLLRCHLPFLLEALAWAYQIKGIRGDKQLLIFGYVHQG